MDANGLFYGTLIEFRHQVQMGGSNKKNKRKKSVNSPELNSEG